MDVMTLCCLETITFMYLILNMKQCPIHSTCTCTWMHAYTMLYIIIILYIIC